MTHENRNSYLQLPLISNARIVVVKLQIHETFFMSQGEGNNGVPRKIRLMRVCLAIRYEVIRLTLGGPRAYSVTKLYLKII